MTAIPGCGDAAGPVVASARGGVRVQLLPILRGGAAGWCITVAPKSGCPITRLSGGPILAEFWTAGGRVEAVHGQASAIDKADRAEGFALTTDAVAAVTVAGSDRIATYDVPGHGKELRAVALTVEGPWAPETKVPSLFGRPPHDAPAGLPHLAPLTAAGETIPSSDQPGGLVVVEIPSIPANHHGATSNGPCSLQPTSPNSVVPRSGSVVPHVRPVRSLLGREFLSCASAVYDVKGWETVAGVLVDASHPGRKPGPLPGMERLPGRAGVYRAPVAEGEALARRVHGGWLVVANGRDARQREYVLSRLRAIVRL